MNKKTVMIGLLVAAAAGAVAGILLAPRKGTKTRRKISRMASGTFDGIKSGFNKIADSLPARSASSGGPVL